MKIVCVYKTGGDFDGEYVKHLYDSLKEYDFICLTDGNDVPDEIEQIPLQRRYRSWWSKMEIFDTTMVHGDILYFDLDTVIRGDVDEMVAECIGKDNMVMLSDFYFPQNLASGIMYIPQRIRDLIFGWWLQNPNAIASKYRGDQNFLQALIDLHRLPVERWDEILDPNYIASYKAHVIKRYPGSVKPKPIDATKSKIICYHGKPRPKDTNWLWKRDS